MVGIIETTICNNLLARNAGRNLGGLRARQHSRSLSFITVSDSLAFARTR